MIIIPAAFWSPLRKASLACDKSKLIFASIDFSKTRTISWNNASNGRAHPPASEPGAATGRAHGFDNGIWYNDGAVLFSTRFPTPQKRGAGAADRYDNLSNRKTLLIILLATLLFAFAAWQEGVVPMATAIAIEMAVHFAITVGSRVEDRT